jgi:Right handed beta helix region
MSRTFFIPAALALAVTLPIAPAQAAGAPRTFLSAAGSDANNCTNVMTPCRHLAAAYAATAANGEIYVLDPANYGSLSISSPVSIEGHGWASIAPTSGNAAITIGALGATDKINIIGVVLDGTGVSGTTGILFNGVRNLTVRDSVIRNFDGDGIFFHPNASTPTYLYVSNTLVSDNNIGGIDIQPSGTGAVAGVLDHLAIESNLSSGIVLQSSSAQTLNFTVSDSVIANNGASGINTQAIGATINVMVRNSTIANNSFGLASNDAGSTIRVTRSTITGNGTGWSACCSGVVLSYADNNIDGNTNVNTEPPSPLTYK